MNVSLRAVTADDEEFLFAVYFSVRAPELAQVPWSDDQKQAFVKMQFASQQAHYQEHNPGATHDLIMLNAEPIGRLYVARRETEIRILDISILPEHRNQGTGTPLLVDLMKEAESVGKPLNISVESFNRSMPLFERLGFERVDTDGVNCLMERRA